MGSLGLVVDRGAVDADVLRAAAVAVDSRWFILHTRSRQEKAIAATLHSMGVDHYLPLISKVQFYGRRKITVNAPLFPGYVFLFGQRDQAFDADRTGRIAQIIDVVDQQQLEHELENIQLALSNEVQLDPFPYLREGIQVVVRAGPLRGVRGLIESRTKCHRLILQVNVLGQASSLEIDGSLLEPIE